MEIFPQRDDGIFAHKSFTIIPNDLSEEEVTRLQKVIVDNSGIFLAPNKDGTTQDIRAHSIVVAPNADFPQYQEALDNNVHVVKPSWIQQSLTKGRCVNFRQHSPDPALIFQDVIITFGDLPRGDKDAITAGVMAMGGLYSSSMTKLVTHIVSLTEDSEKIRIVKGLKLPTKVVLPHWFDDCLKLGKKIHEGPYLLPDPEILAGGGFTPRRPHAQTNLDGATSAYAGNPPPLSPPSSDTGIPSTQRKKLNAFVGKKIFFATDLDIHEKLAKTLQELVERSGGSIAETAADCDVYIGQFRDGDDYILVSRKGKTVANLSWFYAVITRNRWSNPLSQLLHYPIPRDGIPGFEEMRISLSNYTGDARQYLENLIQYAGAVFTKTMKPDNTHLLTAHTKSEKCEAAEEWKIHIVNHQWLEDSYAKCQVQSITAPRYTHFPRKTNLSEVVGTTQIDLEQVRAHFFGEDEDEDEGAEQMEDVRLKPSPRKTVRAMDTNGLQNGAGPVNAVGTPNHRRSSSKENDVPPGTARASKMKAQLELEKAMKDVAEFQKEQARKGGVIHGKKRHVEENTEVSDLHGFNSDGEVDVTRPIKKAKTDDPPITHKMLVTGDERWLKKPKKESDDRKLLRSLGIQLVTDPSQCDLMVAPKLLRTRKFVTAIANAPFVVHTRFLDYVLKHKSLPDDLQKFRLEDKEGETRLGVNLQDAQVRAKDNNHKLLRGWTIYVTDKVNGGYETYADIITTNGGKPVPYRGRSGVTVPKRRLLFDQDPEAGLESQNQGGDVETDYVYLVSGQTDDEVKMWPLFRRLAEKYDLEGRVVRTDWLLNLAMEQRVGWDQRFEQNEGEVAAV
ncbi:BRCT domain-containing protein [Elsinoe fawcettii]|nr:BRCT domain-containing protein [Elsinoe fawcettii]